jgi:hypothetical protein
MFARLSLGGLLTVRLRLAELSGIFSAVLPVLCCTQKIRWPGSREQYRYFSSRSSALAMKLSGTSYVGS